MPAFCPRQLRIQEVPEPSPSALAMGRHVPCGPLLTEHFSHQLKLIFSLWRANPVLLPQALRIRWPRCAEIPQPHRLSEHLICQYEQHHPAKFINPEQSAQCWLREQVRLIKPDLSRGAATYLIVRETHRHKYQGTAVPALAASCFNSLYSPKSRGDLLLISPCKYTSMHSASTFGHIYSPS